MSESLCALCEHRRSGVALLVDDGVSVCANPRRVINIRWEAPQPTPKTCPLLGEPLRQLLKRSLAKRSHSWADHCEEHVPAMAAIRALGESTDPEDAAAFARLAAHLPGDGS